MTRNGRVIGKWSDQLRWSRDFGAFIPNRSKAIVQPDPSVRHVLAEIERARSYLESAHVDPADSSNWLANGELMSVLAPACSPSLLYLARDFSGKWIWTKMAVERSGRADSGPGAHHRRGFTIIRFTGPRTMGASPLIEDHYRLDGKAFPLTVRPMGGQEVQGTALAALDGEKMVVTIQVQGWNEPLRRTSTWTDTIWSSRSPAVPQATDPSRITESSSLPGRLLTAPGEPIAITVHIVNPRGEPVSFLKRGRGPERVSREPGQPVRLRRVLQWQVHAGYWLVHPDRNA